MLANDIMLFSESNTRFVVETDNEIGFEKAMRPIPVWKIGRVSKTGSFRIFDITGDNIVSTDVEKLKKAWQEPFKDL